MKELNKIYNMDCMVGMKDIPDNSIDLVVTDPPYKMTAKGNSGTSGGMLTKQIVKKGNVFKHNNIDISEWLPECVRVMKDASHIYIMTNQLNLREYLNAVNENGLNFVRCLVWNKMNKVLGNLYMSQFEYIIFAYKGRCKHINNCGTSDILSIPNIKTKHDDGSNFHDTQKPVSLMSVLMENSSNNGNLILDPFMGSGTSAISAIKTQRNYVGFEIDKDYYDMACKRIDREKRQVKLWEV